MSVVADNAVHLNVIPRARARSDRLRRGLNDGAAVLLACSEGGGIRRRQRVPVNWTIDDAEFLVDLHAQFPVDVVANVGGKQNALEGRKVRVLDEVLSDVPANEVAAFVVDADFVGFAGSPVDGLEANTFSGTAKESGRGNGMDGVGLIESPD